MLPCLTLNWKWNGWPPMPGSIVVDMRQFLLILEGDGTVEVVVGPVIIEGLSGEVRAASPVAEGRYFAYAEIGMHSRGRGPRFEHRGRAQVGNARIDPLGGTICQATDLHDGFSAAADLTVMVKAKRWWLEMVEGVEFMSRTAM